MIQNKPKYPDFLSQELFLALNRFRSNPKDFIQILQARLPFYRSTLLFRLDHPDSAIQTVQGDKAPKQLIQILSSTQPLPPIQRSKSLQNAALRHARDLGQTGKYQHIGSDSSTIESRVSPDGSWIGHLVQALDCGFREPNDILASLLIDDGLPSRPHRKALLSPDLKYAGAAVHTHKYFQYVAALVFSDQNQGKNARPVSVGKAIFDSKSLQQSLIAKVSKKQSQIIIQPGKQQKYCSACQPY